MNKICIGIVTCPKNEYRFNKFIHLYKKWFNKNNLMYFIIQGDAEYESTHTHEEKKKSSKINSLEYRVDGHYFYCAAKESYETLAHKLAIFYTYIYEKTNYDYVYKIDDGCRILKHEILKTPKYDYCGALIVPTSNRCHKGKCSDKKLNKISLDFTHNFDKIIDMDHKLSRKIKKIKYCAGGYGYVMSRNALQYIPKYKDHILNQTLSYEDVIFGQIMYLENIKPKEHRIGVYHGIED